MAQYADMPADSIGTAVDGCGVTTFAVPLVRAARAFARLVTSGARAPSAIVAAMTGHPGLVAGEGRLETALMEAYPGTVLAKVGAEGVYGAGLPRRRLGIALKVEDGHAWAAVAALLAVLDRLDLMPRPSELLATFAARSIRNTRGEVVGELRADGALTFV